MNIVEKSKELMRKATEENGAPAWLLTELAVEKGRELAAKHDVDEELAVVSLYLAHTVFSPIYKGDIQKKHHLLSADFVKPHLKEWGASEENIALITDAIRAHQGTIPTKNKFEEVVKDAECFKFVTIEGSLIWLHECGRRNYPFEESVEKVFDKIEQKRAFLTLPDCIEEAEKNVKKIKEIFSFYKS